MPDWIATEIAGEWATAEEVEEEARSLAKEQGTPYVKPWGMPWEENPHAPYNVPRAKDWASRSKRYQAQPGRPVALLASPGEIIRVGTRDSKPGGVIISRGGDATLTLEPAA